MKDISDNLKKELFSQESADPFLFLLTIKDPSNQFPPIYLVNNLEDVIATRDVGGVPTAITYIAFPMKIALPVGDSESVPVLKVTISNVTMQFMAMFRTLINPMTGTLEAVLASDPNLVEIAVPDLELRQIDYNIQDINITFALKDMLNLGLPSHNFTPTYYPGLFA